MTVQDEGGREGDWPPDRTDDDDDDDDNDEDSPHEFSFGLFRLGPVAASPAAASLRAVSTSAACRKSLNSIFSSGVNGTVTAAADGGVAGSLSLDMLVIY
jgi:hypothetical protein